MKRRPLTHGITIVMMVMLTSFAARNEPAIPGRWMAGDFHQHTFYTDGGFPIEEVLAKGFEHGLDWAANSEHGGVSMRDHTGQMWNERPDDPRELFKGDERLVERRIQKDGKEETVQLRAMWRWQTLTEFAFRAIQEVRRLNPEKVVATGLEWNVPGHEHCSVGVVAKDAGPVGEFEYRFDRGDDDTSGGPGGQWLGKTFNQGDHAKAVDAAGWLQKNYPESSWVVFAHPERASSYTIADFRDFNNAAPTVAFGFEGLPGHQKRENRGSYGQRAVGNGTHGGAGWYIAKVGGLWDALLGEGRHWWTFVSSDFHRTQGDFWPGEYAKTWTYVRDGDGDGAFTVEDIPGALRSGNTFCVHGELIDRLHFLAVSGERSATMGETLTLSKGDSVEVRIRFRSPAKNPNGDQPKVRAIQLIAGDVRDRVPKFLDDGVTPNRRYVIDENETTHIAALYREADLNQSDDGWYETPPFRISKVERAMYFRIRGSSLPPSTPYETDAAGNPLPDELAISELKLGAEEAVWRDLWFYANPIFVRPE